MSVELHHHCHIKAIETVTDGLDWATGGDIVHQIATLYGRLDGDTAIDADIVWSDTRSLVAGSDTIDLTAVTRPAPFSTLDLTGYYLRFLVIYAAATNTAAIKIAGTALQAYTIWGDTMAYQWVFAGGWSVYNTNGKLTVPVSATVKNWKQTSSDADATYSLLTIWGNGA